MGEPINDGGPAFPCSRIIDGGEAMQDFNGLSRRDYFAAEAMAALAPIVSESKPISGGVHTFIDLLALTTDCFKAADAMLAASGAAATPAPLNTRLAEMVRKLEWAGTELYVNGLDCSTCPVCNMLRPGTCEHAAGHASDCPLAALLAEIDAAPKDEAREKALEACRLIDEFHTAVFCTGRSLILENTHEKVDHTKFNEAAQLAQAALKAAGLPIAFQRSAEIDAAPGKPGAGKGAVEELVAAGRELLRTTRLTTFAGGPTSKICDRFELALAAIDPGAGTEGGSNAQ